ncbi:hypothetical protein [Streptomyces ipomoeae]|uniref:hypothetical protein n=1 Tax=Streptomyces ipomoeae TaxID=103232 RepID=UPI0015F09477|nr:hypothetical protein [Streptomyces ipomoeae]
MSHEPVTVVNLAQLPARAATPAPPGRSGLPKQGGAIGAAGRACSPAPTRGPRCWAGAARRAGLGRRTARREQRHSALRLAGATPQQILAMTAVEAAGVGAAGALVGALAYTALLPALAELPYGLGAWCTGQLWWGRCGAWRWCRPPPR